MHKEDDPEKRIINQLKVFCEDLSTELSSVFRKDLNLIENTRNITDFKGMAMQLKKWSPTLLHELDGEKFIKSLKVVIQLVKKVNDESLRLQQIRFLKKVENFTNDISIEDLQKMDLKILIKQFANNQNCFIGLERIMHSVFVSSIKVSVKSVAESMISKYALHFNKIRNMDENKVHNEMMIDCNGPEIGECDDILKNH